MSTDIDILKFYTKGKSIIRGSFPISNTDQFGCINLSENEDLPPPPPPPPPPGGGADCTECSIYALEESGGFCAFKQNNITTNGHTNILGRSDKLVINLNGTGPYATPAPIIASYRPTDFCKFKTKTIHQVGPGSDIYVISTFNSSNTKETNAYGSILYTVDDFGTLITYTAILKKVNNAFYWDFSISCTPPLPSSPQTNTVSDYPVGGSAYTPDFTGMTPVGGGYYTNLLPWSACGATVPTQGITAGGIATITLSDPVYL
jgi:hypothetical protein